VKLRTSDNPNRRAADLVQEALSGHSNVLLLLSGGSATKVYEELATRTFKKPSDLRIGLIDERYNQDPGHANANSPQIKQTGINKWGEYHAILQGQPLQETVSEYESWIKPLLSDPAVYKVGILGIGPDGHTAGILPDSDSARFDLNFGSSELVVGYENDGPYPLRITLTPVALKMLDEAIVIAADPAKLPVIQKLQDNPPAHEMPATILKDMHNVTIVTTSVIPD
jgi:6-phosphogluconolactonase/glucosamine-6-phosphate isomerase/deaminase